MDISFDINNEKGDHNMVALSEYDKTSLSAITGKDETFELELYDVSLARIAGTGMVGYRILMRIAEILAKFLLDNDKVVLCFYCDGRTDINRHHKEIPPQEYRSLLFSRMFDMYVRKSYISGLVNYPVVVTSDNDPWKAQYAHFICRNNHLSVISHFRDKLMSK